MLASYKAIFMQVKEDNSTAALLYNNLVLLGRERDRQCKGKDQRWSFALNMSFMQFVHRDYTKSCWKSIEPLKMMNILPSIHDTKEKLQVLNFFCYENLIYLQEISLLQFYLYVPKWWKDS